MFLYFFTCNSAKRPVRLNSDFHLITMPWEFNNAMMINSRKYNFSPSLQVLNIYDFNSAYFHNLFNQRNLLCQYNILDDGIVRETLLKQISEQLSVNDRECINYMRYLADIFVIETTPMFVGSIEQYLLLYCWLISK